MFYFIKDKNDSMSDSKICAAFIKTDGLDNNF